MGEGGATVFSASESLGVLMTDYLDMQ